ncbi:Atpase family aaa domain-containing protein 3, partial [Globisporangium splendens]
MVQAACCRRIMALYVAFCGVAMLVLSPPSVVDAVVKRTRAQMLMQQNQEALPINYKDTLLNVRPANASHSYDLIRKLPIKHFRFKYDANAGRTQLGCLGEELQEVYPDGVQFVPKRFVFDSEKQRIALQNLYVVDKDSLFMHNLAATQVVIGEQQEQEQDLYEVRQSITIHHERLVEMQAYLDQEASVQLIEKRKIAEAEVVHAEKLIEEARRKNDLEIETTKHQLGQQRLEEEDAARLKQNRDLVALQEESNMRMEIKRRETEEVLKEKQLVADHQRALLERNTTLEKAVIDVEGRIKQQRLNQDIEMVQLQQRLEADRVKLMQALQATFDNLGQGAVVLLSDKEKLTKFVGGFVALAAGIYFSREAIRIIGKLIEQRLGKPSLVRETSRGSGLWGFFRTFFSYWSRLKGKKNEIADVVLHASLETRVLEIARSTRNSILHGAPYRHLLLYGPPGTGKTMVAKRLAKSSGMDYAILSGGDVGPLGSDAVTELHALLNWSNSSPRGVLIFIDEAKAFLGCRVTKKTHMSEAMRNALNALLFHTGTQSRYFMLVIATNRPEDLDTAVTDRIDDTLHFDLPEESERVRLLQMYFDEYVGHMTMPAATKQYGAMTEGMSGREIAKMMLYLQSIVYAQDEVVVTPKLIDRVVREKVDEHKRKLELKNYKD